MILSILGLCARDQGHAAMYTSLELVLADYQKRNQAACWEALVNEAERQGLAPLLYKHLKAIDYAVPELSARRLLQSLYLRSRRANDTRNTAMTEILAALQRENLPVLLVKGIALANFAYGSPELRPMRDIDLLVAENQLLKAERILLDLGYQPEQDHDIPPDYYHLVPLTKVIDGLPVSIELHHNLLPLQQGYPLWPLGKSLPTAMTFSINQCQAHTLCLEENLWYVYLHGFRAPLTYEALRFVHVADMVNIVETYLDRIDWQRVRLEYPLLLPILSRFHFLTPWPDRVIQALALPVDDCPAQPGISYRGWPQRRFKTIKTGELMELVRQTLWPPQWWLQVYYGRLHGAGYLQARLIKHPRSVWRWIKAHYHSSRKTAANQRSAKKSSEPG